MRKALVLGIALAGAVGTVAFASPATKVKICHLPPGDPWSFHTITVSANAVRAHISHGDLPGGCFESCAQLCDDGDPCTIDACDPVTEQCLVDRAAVDCNDGDACTVDSCDSASGACLSTPRECDDGLACTYDACLDGECANIETDCGGQGVCIEDTGLCANPCDGVVCDPCAFCPQLPGTAGCGSGTVCSVDPEGQPACLASGPCEYEFVESDPDPGSGGELPPEPEEPEQP